jgi:hypothetical protein
MPKYVKFSEERVEEGTYSVEETIESARKSMKKCEEAIETGNLDAAQYFWKESSQLFYIAYVGVLYEDKKLTDLILSEEKKLEQLRTYFLKSVPKSPKHSDQKERYIV